MGRDERDESEGVMKYRYKRKASGWVWCDYHCEIHERIRDIYNTGIGEHECNRNNWRKVYVETDDKEETF